MESAKNRVLTAKNEKCIRVHSDLQVYVPLFLLFLDMMLSIYWAVGMFRVVVGYAELFCLMRIGL